MRRVFDLGAFPRLDELVHVEVRVLECRPTKDEPSVRGDNLLDHPFESNVGERMRLFILVVPASDI